MIETSPLPGDPTELRLRVTYVDELCDTPDADTLERWDVAVVHRRQVHDDRRCPDAPSECRTDACPACSLEDAAVGSMTFYRVHLDRGRNAYGALATEAIFRLMPGCRAVACSPGVSDLSADRLRDEAEWDRITTKIARGWERIGFLHYRENVCVLSPTSLVLEEQRGQLRRGFVELGAAWAARARA